MMAAKGGCEAVLMKELYVKVKNVCCATCSSNEDQLGDGECDEEQGDYMFEGKCCKQANIRWKADFSAVEECCKNGATMNNECMPETEIENEIAVSHIALAEQYQIML